MVAKRSTSAETAARFFALRAGRPLPRRRPLTEIDIAFLQEIAKQRRLRVVRMAFAALTLSEQEEFLAEMIALYGLPRVLDAHDSAASKESRNG